MAKIFSDAEMTPNQPEQNGKEEKDDDSEDIEDLMNNLQSSVNMENNTATVMNEQFFKFEQS